jgi:hypothetical protein
MAKFDKNLESAELKAQARINAFNRKQGVTQENPDVEDFKRKMVAEWMKEPEVLQDLMKAAPKEMNSLIQRYGVPKGR